MNNKFKYLDINSIELDKDNPRIKRMLEIYETIGSREIALALNNPEGENTTSYEALKESIKISKGIIHPILVNKVGDKLTVIEGNTRLQIYKEFAKNDHENKATGLWDSIPAMVTENMEQEEIEAIRLQSHLVGARDWEPYSKAKYLYNLSEVEMLPLDRIIALCGGNARKNQIITFINGYKDMENYYSEKMKANGDIPNPKVFSYFEELQKNSAKDAITYNDYTFDDFADWVINENIETAQSVRKLRKILNNKKARNKFLQTNVGEAMKILAVEEHKEDGLELPYEIMAKELIF